MDKETLKKVEQSIQKLVDRESRIYFLVQDTKGNGKASVRMIYQIAKTLRDAGFNSIIIHEQKDYIGVSDWLDSSYMELPHQAIENQNLEISPEDFIVIPELYGHVLEQLSNFPAGKVIICQAYDHMLETLQPGAGWTQFGFRKCITTSETQKTYIDNVMKGMSFDIIEPLISNTFTKKEKPAKPIVSIHCREQRNTAKIIKTFYLKYPQFRWITFRDMRGLSEKEFSDNLKQSFVSVWVDDESAFGTFPIESMSVGTPVIGKVPNMKPEWITDHNGVWTYEFNNIVDILADYIQNWLEDNISQKLYDSGYETASQFTNEEEFKNKVIQLFDEYLNVRLKAFQEQLDKQKVEEEN